jgi:tripartite-type tricarboxylate transporter receptor subunit TctC
MGARDQRSPHKVRIAAGLLLAATACFPGAADAQQPAGYPNRPIRIIVPLTAGGNLDLIARAVAEPLARALGQPVIVENRPGSSGLIGTQIVAKSPPDGYTLLAQANTFVSAASILPDPGYDPVRDFAGVTLTCRIPMVLVVNPGIAAKTVGELIEQAKAHPGELAYASSGIGSTGHIAAELFSGHAGIKMLHVAYKGNSQAMVDVIAGQVPLMFDQVSTAAPQIHSGKLRALGVTTRTRSTILPDVPTIDQAGLPGFDDSTWNGLLAPAGTPREVLVRLRNEVAQAFTNPALVKRYAERGVELMASGAPEEFTSFIRDEAVRYGKLVRETHIKAE